MSEEAVTVTRLGRAHLVRLAGEIDMANAETIEAEVAGQTAPATAVLVDLTAVGFLDSSGVRLLDRLVASYEQRGVPVRLVAPATGPARLTLTLCAFRDDLMAADLTAASEALTG